MRAHSILVSIHAVAGVLALSIIVGFWVASVGALLVLDAVAVAAVKDGIAWGLCALLPALIAVGGSGARLSRRRGGPVIAAKQARMHLAAAIGLTVLVPTALALAFADVLGLSGWGYGLVQGAELIAGTLNIALLGANMRDGLALRRRRARSLDREADAAAAG